MLPIRLAQLKMAAHGNQMLGEAGARSFPAGAWKTRQPAQEQLSRERIAHGPLATNLFFAPKQTAGMVFPERLPPDVKITPKTSAANGHLPVIA